MPTIIGSTTLSVKHAAIAASIALPPAASISAPAAVASGWLVTTMPRAPCAGRFSHAKVAPALVRQSLVVIGGPSQPRRPGFTIARGGAIGKRRARIGSVLL